MLRQTKDTQIEVLPELRKIAERDPMKAVEAFIGRVFSNPPEEKGAELRGTKN